MRLYRITTHFYGKDLNQRAYLGYLAAENEEAVFDHISKAYHGGEWDGYRDEDDEDSIESADRRKAKIIAEKGDTKFEYEGEFYDQKYGWEDLGPITEDDIAALTRLHILKS